MKPTEQPRLVLSTHYTRRGALHPMWGATPDQKRCNAHRSGAAPNATSIFADAQSHQSSADAHHPSTAPFTSRYTRCGALHPIRRGAMPTDRVQRHFQQAFSRTRNDTNYQPTHTTQALHPLRRATPDVGRCTRCGALHPMWGATPDQKRCNAYGSSAAPHATSIFADARYSLIPHRHTCCPHLGHLPLRV